MNLELKHSRNKNIFNGYLYQVRHDDTPGNIGNTAYIYQKQMSAGLDQSNNSHSNVGGGRQASSGTLSPCNSGENKPATKNKQYSRANELLIFENNLLTLFVRLSPFLTEFKHYPYIHRSV